MLVVFCREAVGRGVGQGLLMHEGINFLQQCLGLQWWVQHAHAVVGSVRLRGLEGRCLPVQSCPVCALPCRTPGLSTGPSFRGAVGAC